MCERTLGGAALLLGLLFLLGDVSLVWLAFVSGALLIAAGLACVVGLLPSSARTGWAVVGLGVFALSSLLLTTPADLAWFRVLAGAAFGLFGIVKLT